LSQELPALVGRVEELEYQNQKLVESIAFLKQEMEKAAAAKEAAPPPTVQTGSEPSADPKPEVDDYATLSVEDLEKKAKASLVAAQYDEARLLFERLLTKDLSVEQEISARFYLGEIWFLKKQHGKASDYYLKAYQKDPKGPKAPKSLLKVALSLQSLGKKKEACITLKKLLKDHPKAESTVLAMAKEKKAECCGA
jgi:TolA-binding protein